MKVIKNPTNKDIFQHAGGNEYKIPAGWQGELADDIAEKLLQKQPSLVEVKPEKMGDTLIDTSGNKPILTEAPAKKPFWDKSYRKNKGEK
jgi:hypothetical protein